MRAPAIVRSVGYMQAEPEQNAEFEDGAERPDDGAPARPVEAPLETPIDDAVEQAMTANPADDDRDDLRDVVRGLEVDEADASEQARAAGLDDEEHD